MGPRTAPFRPSGHVQDDTGTNGKPKLLQSFAILIAKVQCGAEVVGVLLNS